MPELPEVETIRRSLLAHVQGRTITRVKFGNFAGVISGTDPDTFAALITGRSVAGIRRRGKYLLVDLDDESGFIVHLRMTGNLSISRAADEPVRFEQVAMVLDNGYSMRFSDQRKFGRIEYRPADRFRPLENKLGPEPLESRFTAGYLAGRLRGRTAPIKALILDQRMIAGIGNIYADEALFRSRIHPLVPGGMLSESQIRSLVRSIRSILRDAIEHRGTTFSSYRDADGAMGSNQFRLSVYGKGRRGEPCLRCSSPLAAITVGGRTSHYCPRCQPAPARGDSTTTR
jgi:formamidopyrimidine-DNA glycosylase